MITTTNYNATTGKILYVCVTKTKIHVDEWQSGYGVIEGNYPPEDYWIDGTTPTAKTANPATIASQTISNIYNPSTVDCGELGSYTVTDGEFEFTIDTAGTYDITVQSVPHFDKTFTVVIV